MNIKLLIFCLLFSKLVLAQTEYNYIKVCKWEGITKNSQRIFGVTTTIDEAISIKEKFNKEQDNINNKIIHFAYTTLSVKHRGKLYFFKNFKNQYPNQYIIFSLEEQQAISIYANESLDRAITYYSKAKNIKYSVAHKQIEKLILKDCPYKLNFRLNLKSILF